MTLYYKSNVRIHYCEIIESIAFNINKQACYPSFKVSYYCMFYLHCDTGGQKLRQEEVTLIHHALYQALRWDENTCFKLAY